MWAWVKWGVGIVIRCMSVVFVLAGVGASLQEQRPIPLMTAGFIGVLLFYFSRMLMGGYGESLLQHDTRPPILYLRSFDSDTGAITSSWWKPIFLPFRFGIIETDEEALSRVLSRIGSFIAIGDPHDWVLVVGASRVYRADDAWQRTIRDLINRACLVIIRVGETPGLLWELETVAELIGYNKVVFWNPKRGRRRRDREILDNFLRVVAEVFSLSSLNVSNRAELFSIITQEDEEMPRQQPMRLQDLFRIYTGGVKAVRYKIIFRPILAWVGLSAGAVKIKLSEVANICLLTVVILSSCCFLWFPKLIVMPILLAKKCSK
jgi:hypothetical protein